MPVPNFIQEVYTKSSCLYTGAQVHAALDQMANAIYKTLYDKNPLVLTVLMGGMISTGHLLTRLEFPLTLDCIHATRYNSGLTASHIKWLALPRSSLKDRAVLIVDDILDAGITLAAIVNYCKAQGAKAVYTAVLVEKLNSRVTEGLQKADFVGLTALNQYLFGYGLDYKEYLRNAPGIFAVPPNLAD